MNLLAVDTAGKTSAVAVMAQDRLLYEAQLNNGLTHSETLLPMIDTALRCAGLDMDRLDLLAVTNGPGSCPAWGCPRWRRWLTAAPARAPSSAHWTPAGGRCTGRGLTLPATPG